MGDIVFYSLLGLHLVAVVGMAVAVVLQLAMAPGGPLRILKWVWLPTVGGAAVTGLALWAMAAPTGHPVDTVKMLVKVGAVVLGSAIAAKYHAADRADTPSWAVPAMSTVVGSEVLMSTLWA